MALYDGVPSIRLEGDMDRALALIPQGKTLLYEVQAILKRAKVGTYSLARRVDDDSYIFVLCANGINIIQISVAPKVPDQANPPDGIIPDSLLPPDFYSGLVFNGYEEQKQRQLQDGSTTTYGVCATFSPTPTCQRTHVKELPTLGRQRSRRLDVKPSNELAELRNRSESGIPVYTQYTKLRSSMYSGTMAKVVQVALGLGRINVAKFKSLATLNFPETPYMKDVASNGVQIVYDYKFSRTHGITRASDGRLWLVEISVTRGVVAMLLPIFPNSNTAAFYAAAEKNDPAMRKALDDLGCLPTGEGFPTGKNYDAKVLSGDILQLLSPDDMKEFYQYSGYSSSMGWAFNSTGNEAHNTAHYFDDVGFQRGCWYQINISIGALIANRPKGSPAAVASATLRKQNDGYIWCPPVADGAVGAFVPIKFHEPMLPGLMSFDGRPAVSARSVPAPRCDTPMFVCFVDDELKLVKFYRGDKADTYNYTDDPRFPGECILNGTWVITQYSGSRSFPTMMYTNDFDDRQVLNGSVVTTTIDSRDSGYTNPVVADDIVYPRTAYVTRSKAFKRTTTTDARIGEIVGSVVAIPEYSREAYYYATGHGYGSHTKNISVAWDFVADPNVAYTWRCFPGGANAPQPECPSNRCGGFCDFMFRGSPTYRQVVCLLYRPSGTCYDYADSGPWLQLCQSVDSYIGLPPKRYPPSSTYTDYGTDQTAALFLVSAGYGGPVKIPLTYAQFTNHWQTPSPDPETGIVQFITAEHSAIGSDLVVYQTGLSSYDSGQKAVGYAPENIDGTGGYPCIIGVNQV
jgi:hypothetical protein